jgi:hypothetical protein
MLAKRNPSMYSNSLRRKIDTYLIARRKKRIKTNETMKNIKIKIIIRKNKEENENMDVTGTQQDARLELLLT